MYSEQQQEIKPKKRSWILSILFILLISFLAYLAIRPSFNLALGGDDWGIHYLIWQIFDLAKDASYFNPLTYFCTYCPHYFFLSIISRPLGYEPFYYFFAAYLARIIAAVGIFLLVKRISGRVLMAVLASAFFSVSYLGIEATDWAFNYNYYLGIGVVCIFLIWYWKAKETLKFKPLLISGLLVSAAAVIAPARMHGLIPLLLIIESAWWLIEKKGFNLKMAALRVGVASFFYYIVLYGVSDLYIYIRDRFGFEIGPYYVGNGYGAKEWNAQRTQDGIKFIIDSINKGKSDLIVDPIATLGNYIMPDMLWTSIPFSQFSLFGKEPFTFFSYLLPITLIFGGLTIAVLYLAGLKNKFTPFYLINLLFLLIFIYILQKMNITTFSYARVAFSLIGGFAIIFSIWLFFLLRKTRPLFATVNLLGIGWMFTFILFPWIIGPYGIINTWGRYSIQQGAGLAIWMAMIFTLVIDALNKKRKFGRLGITYLLIFLFVFMHIKFANDYLSYVATYRSNEIDVSNWKVITSQVPTIDNNGLNIFLLLTDQESANTAEAIRFGFYGRASIFYNTRTWQYSPFMVVNEYESVLSSVYDGKYLTKQGRNPTPTTVDRIYAFALQNKQMYNVTDQIRKRLNEDLEALNKGTLTLPQQFQ